MYKWWGRLRHKVMFGRHLYSSLFHNTFWNHNVTHHVYDSSDFDIFLPSKNFSERTFSTQCKFLSYLVNTFFVSVYFHALCCLVMKFSKGSLLLQLCILLYICSRLILAVGKYLYQEKIHQGRKMAPNYHILNALFITGYILQGQVQAEPEENSRVLKLSALTLQMSRESAWVGNWPCDWEVSQQTSLRIDSLLKDM